jgi:hypothetical protein
MINLLQQKYPFSIALLVISLLLTQDIFAQRSFTQRITPRHIALQYAGSIGYTSVGFGYDLFKKTELSFHYGYVPEVKGGELHIVALKFQYKPFNIHLTKGLVFHPINPVVFASYTMARNFSFGFDADQYPKGYYFWSPALREHLGVSTELEILGDKSSRIKSISLYTEANTNDLYMVSWYENRTTTPVTKIFRLGFGIKMNF